MNKTAPKHTCEPAWSVIELCGGQEVVRKALDLKSRRDVWRWCVSRQSHGTGGVIPDKYQRKLLEWARCEGIPLTAEMVIGVKETKLSA